MHTNTKTTVLAISAILMTIALVTSSSLVASAIAVKTHKSKSTSSSDKSSKGGTSSSSTTGVSKLVSCIRALPSTFTRADVDNCYDTAYKTGGGTASSVGGASSAGGSTLGTP